MPPTITGSPITRVNIFPRSIESEGESSFCFRNNKVSPAKDIPDNIASTLPKYPSKLRSSKKKRARPSNNIIIVAQSTKVDFSPRNMYPNNAT